MCNLLIVEDNSRDLRFLTETVPFDKWGLNLVGTAPNGEDALVLIETLHPDIIITDISMPIVNGIAMAQTLSKKYPKIKLLFMSHYDDFSFAKSAIDYMVHGYILKPIDIKELEAACKKLVALCDEEKRKSQADADLLAQLESSIPILQQAFLREMLSGTGLDEDMIRERLSLLHIKGADFIKVAVVSATVSPSLEEISARRDYLNRLEVVNSLTQQTKDYCAHVIQNANNPLVILFFYSNENPQPLLLSYVTKAWERLDGKVDFGISTASSEAGDIPTLTRNAQAAADARFYGSASPFIFYEEIAYAETDVETGTFNLMSLRQEIDEKIFMGEASGADAFIDTYLNDRFVDEIYLKSLSYSILNILMLMLKEKGLNYPEMDTHAWSSKKLWQKLYSFKSADDLRQWIKDIIYSVQGFIEEKNTSRYAGLVKIIKNVVKDRYKEPISVPDIAQAVYLSPKQANAVFKREEGVTIFDYLVGYRINQAKKLLKETNLTIQVIAETVGYSNKSHFAIMFKRGTGMTPAEYKNRPVL